ncbi:hypothetical protein BLNAU_5807 [Blattamonas nauphoetae]|uniref:EF-hand domain-containing protein n=1 Tax=Blattamonas nauphoetae TaxID=2049346 RepID=A0ABQ9Y6B9_9EUKA|nr:hypothetical protein BLNAU_5807 [Blattamonas nauphoetae]
MDETDQIVQEEAEVTERLDREQQILRGKLSKRIQDSFRIFDPENRGAIPVEEIRYVIHSLDLCPTEEQLTTFSRSIAEDETVEITIENLEAALLPKMARGEWKRPSEELLLQAFRTIETTLNQMQAAEEEAARQQIALEFEEVNDPVADNDEEEKKEEGEAEPEAGGKKKKKKEKAPAQIIKLTKPKLPPLSGYLTVEKLSELMSMHGEPLRDTELEDFVKNLPSEDSSVEYSKIANILANE